MKKSYGKLKPVLIALLSLTLIFSVAFASVAFAAPATNEQGRVIEVTSDDSSLRIAIDAQRLDDLTRNDVSPLRSELVDQLKDIILNQLMPESAPEAARINAVRKLRAPETGSERDILGRYRELLEQRLREPGELEKYLNGDYDIAIKQAAAEYMDKHEDFDATQVEQIVEEVNEIVEDAIVEEAVKEKYPEVADDPELLKEKKQEVKEDLASGKDREEVLGSQYADLLKHNETKSEEMTETVKDIVENGAPALEFSDLLVALRGITVGGHVIRTEQDGWLTTGVKDLVLDLVKKVRDAQNELVITYDVELQLSLGDVHFTLTVELVNYDGSFVQAAINYVKDHIDFGKVDGVWTLNVNVPEGLLNFYNFIEDEKFQRDLFEISSLNPQGILEKIKTYSAEDMLNVLRNVNYEEYAASLLDQQAPGTESLLKVALKLAQKVATKSTVEEVEKVLENYGVPGVPAKLEGFVQVVLNELKDLNVKDWNVNDLESFLRNDLDEEMDKIFDRLENSNKFNDLYDTIINYAERGIKYIPNVFQNETLTNLVADGELSWQGELDLVGLEYDPILTRAVRRVASFLGLEENSQIESIVTWIDNNIKYEDVAASIHANLPNLHKVSFTSDNQTVEGLVFDGASVEFFANKTEGKDGKNILAWLDENDQPHTEITEDVALHAVTEFDVEIVQVDDKLNPGELSDKTYDGKQIHIYATEKNNINGEGHKDYTYKWYKDDEELVGETADTLTLEGNFSDSGKYKVVVSSATYEHTAEAEVEIVVKKLTIDFEPEWDYGEGYDDNEQCFHYDGKTHSVTLKNGSELDAKVGEHGWTLTGNTGILKGEYTAEIVIYSENYALENASSLTWYINEAKEPTPPQPSGDVGEKNHEFGGSALVVDGTTITVKDVDGVVPVDTKLLANATTGNYQLPYFKTLLEGANKNTDSAILQVLNIYFENWSGNGTFVVTLTNKDKFANLTADDLVLVHLHNGQHIVNATVENGTITFTVENFSEFAVLSQSAESSADTWWIWLLLAIIIILNIVIILLLLRRKNDNEPTDGEPTEEQPADEQPAEEQPTEEVTEQPAADEQPVAAVVAEEPDEPEEPFVLPIVTGERTVLDRSFMARLSQSEDIVKEMYSELKNDLLSYKKIRSRVSWKFDSFYKGRNKCVILQLRGKKINMYIALRAEDLEPKYHAKDVSDKNVYQSVPTLVKISGSRSLKYAKQLIALLMANLDVPRTTEQHVNYKIRRRSTNHLIRDGYIKIKTSKGRFASPAEQNAPEQANEAQPDEQAATVAAPEQEQPAALETTEQPAEQPVEEQPATEQPAEEATEQPTEEQPAAPEAEKPDENK